VVDVDDVAVAGDRGEIRCALKLRITLSSPRWNGARCPELVAGSGKQVEVVLMVAYDVQDVSTDRSRGRGAGHPITTHVL